MTIQFKCPACGQPIEVDDQDAGSNVQCYYCKTAVTAPQQSTLSSGGERIPTSRPAGGSGPVFRHISEEPLHVSEESPARPEGFSRPQAVDQRPQRFRGLAMLSLGCSSAALAVFVVMMVSMVPSVMGQLSQNSDLDIENQKELLRQQAEQLQQAPLMRVGNIAVLGLSIAGSICGLAALVRRTTSRRAALIGLLLGLAFMVCQCGGAFMATSMGLIETTG